MTKPSFPPRRRPSITRDRVLAAARRAFAEGRSPTLGQVASAAGVSRATVHRLFSTRSRLLAEIELEPDPGSRERILAAALELIDRDGLARLVMDEVAERAGVSRASLYRRFPGKAALFRELVRAYSPLQPVVDTLASMSGRPPAEVMPALARAAAKHLEGRGGLLRSVLLEAIGPSADAAAAQDFAVSEALQPFLAYLLTQMREGRLRPMHPLLAMQSFAAPIVFHLLTRPLAEARIGFAVPLEEAAGELAEAWLRAMNPTQEESGQPARRGGAHD